MPGLASISIDLDGLLHYAALHGLPAGVITAEARELVHRVAVPRFAELLEGVGGRGTLFVIGGEVDQAGRAPLEDALRRGHELGSHTHGHDYALSRASPEDIDRDLARAEGVLASLGAAAPLGFRAPGYTLAGAAARRGRPGYAYDASIFPAVPYWAAKALTLGWLRLRDAARRPSSTAPACCSRPGSPTAPTRTGPSVGERRRCSSCRCR
jgi:hypothetical protein